MIVVMIMIVDISHYELHYVNCSCPLNCMYEKNERW